MNYIKKQNHSLKNLSDCIRILSADAIETAKSGHPGMPLGFADVMTCLAFNFLKFNPHDPKWPNRDRLILSCGHGSMLLYSFFYLAGYKDFFLEDIKNFRQLNSKTAGHPEYGLFNAIETTTGPLGQGLANSVGMAIAEKKYKAELTRNICNYKIYCIVGDGCLMEGIAYESASLAGHLKLNNLIILFDSNNITIDGSTDLSISENQLQKFEAMGFYTESIDGHDYNQINKALANAQNSDKPTFIECKTIIGKGVLTKSGTASAHGAPLGLKEIDYLKSIIDFASPHDQFFIEPELKKLWEKAWKRNKQNYDVWQKDFSDIKSEKKLYLEYPKIELKNFIHKTFLTKNKVEATRASSSKIIEHILKSSNKVILGSADLSTSNGILNKKCKIISSNDFSGNFIHYGVREHAMAGIMNGVALSGFMTIGATFFAFSDYMRPAIRLSALMKLPVIYVMTHDSIGVGEDGPTHQPIEHLPSFRAMHNINVFRPADFIETFETYSIALSNNTTPSIMALSRQKLLQVRKFSNKNLSSKGAYIISEATNVFDLDVIIFATGSEVSLALEVQIELQKNNLSVRVCSVPSVEILHKQGKDYLLYLKNNAKLNVVIEAASSFGWHQIVGCDGLFFCIENFGASAHYNELYKYFNFTKENITESILETIK